MLALIITFFFLYALIWVFERKNREIDSFEILLIVIGPAIVAGLVDFLFNFLGLEAWSGYIAALVYAIIALILLIKPLEFPLKRAVLYTVAIFSINLVASFGLQFVFSGR